MFTIPDIEETIECETHKDACEHSKQLYDKYDYITILGNMIYCRGKKTSESKRYYLGQQK